MKTYDAIVLGVGGMGSAACCHIASRGLSVLGLEQFHLVHDRGSSHGRTRIIRKAYWEHPDYVPLLHRCYELWRELERSAGQSLLEITGLLLVGPPTGELIRGASISSKVHGLAVQPLSSGEIQRRFGAFRPSEEMTGLYEVDAGLLHVERCVQAQIDQARSKGADIRERCAVQQWSADDQQVIVETDEGRFAARSLVVTAGAWSGRVLASAGVPLELRRKPVFWFPSRQGYWDRDADCPLFAFDAPWGFFYGFPRIDELGVKVAEHSGGAVVTDPTNVMMETTESDLAPIRRFMECHLNGVESTPSWSSVCMYTMTPDQHFVVDRHPGFANVFLACGFSGHGFKFAPVIGSIMADLVTTGRTSEPVAFLSLRRFHSR